jgi:DNA-directed RNA polymerase subunit E'
MLMYKILTVKDKVRVPPSKFGLHMEEAVKASLEDRWEGIIDRRLGVILSVTEVKDVGEGAILPGDGAIHYPVEFRILVYYPEMHELIKGYVIDVTEFGIFIRMGPLDGMVHVSQIMDDFVSYDNKNSIFMGRDTKRTLKESDLIRARIISISMASGQYKIGLTTRQPGLGVLAWQERDKQKAGVAPKKEASPAKPAPARKEEKPKPEKPRGKRPKKGKK